MTTATRTWAWPIRAVALDVSGSCNLACRYCAEAATQPERCGMSPDTLGLAWDLLFPDGTPVAGTSIRLGSGEPLLALPLLRALQERIEAAGGSAHDDRPAVHITTNGTLASRAVRDWLVAAGWRVKISLDGPQPIHDRWRVRPGGRGTWRRVSEAVADLAARIPDRFSVTAVLCRGADPGEVFGAAADLGVRRIELVPVAHTDPEVLPGAADLDAYRGFVNAYADALSRGEEPPVLIRFESTVRRALGFDRTQLPCGAGRSFLGVGPGGELYPCFRFVGMPQYRLGTLPDGLDRAAATAFAADGGRRSPERPDCRDCPAAALCGGPCFATAEMFGPGHGAPLPLHCAYVRADAAAADRLVRELRSTDPLRLVAFLPPAAREMVDAL